MKKQETLTVVGPFVLLMEPAASGVRVDMALGKNPDGASHRVGLYTDENEARSRGLIDFVALLSRVSSQVLENCGR